MPAMEKIEEIPAAETARTTAVYRHTIQARRDGWWAPIRARKPAKPCLALDTMTYPADVQHHRAPYHDRLLHLPAPPSCYPVISTPPKTRDALLFWRELRPLCLFLYSPYPPPHHPPAARRPRMTEARKAGVDVPGSSARQKTNTCRITFLFVFPMF